MNSHTLFILIFACLNFAILQVEKNCKIKDSQKKLAKFTREIYTQTKKTMNTENIPGMCVSTNYARPCNRRKWMGSQSRNGVGS